MNGRIQVWEAVEQFRATYLGPRGDQLPVDVFTLVELDLRLNVIPFDDLAAKYRVEAALTQDFSGMYVDAESYVYWGRGPVWKQNRLRFTVAHEIGHYVLHREQTAKTSSFHSNSLPPTSRPTTDHGTSSNKRRTSSPAVCWCR